MKTPSDEFVAWCRAEPPKPRHHFVLKKYVRETTKTVVDFVDEVVRSLTANSTPGITFDDVGGAGEEINFMQTKLRYDREIALLEISSFRGEFSALNLCINHCTITTGAHPTTIVLNNCMIRTLYTNQCNSVTLVNCQIGTLALINASIKNFSMRGGSVLNIECQPPWEKSPFIGSVSMSDVFLPRTPKKYLIKTAQPYRNLRAHLRSLENSHGSSLLHSAELAMERETDTNTNKLLSHLYEQFSDFGSSTLRPIVWLFMFWLLTSVFLYLTNGAVLASTTDAYTAWRKMLMSNDSAGEISRAAILSLQQLASPLTILGAKPLVLPRNMWIAAWSVVHSVFSGVLIALFVLAVRRRFKMQ